MVVTNGITVGEIKAKFMSKVKNSQWKCIIIVIIIITIKMKTETETETKIPHQAKESISCWVQVNYTKQTSLMTT